MVFNGSTSMMLKHIANKHGVSRVTSKQSKLSLRVDQVSKTQELNFLFAAALAMDAKPHNSGLLVLGN